VSTGRGLLIACGEPAIRDVLLRFEAERFPGLPVERILLPGGCWWVSEAAAMTGGRIKRLVASRSSTYEAVGDMLADPGIGSVALVAHQDCQWYRGRSPRSSAGELVKRAGADLYAARDEIVRLAGRHIPITGTVLLHIDEAWSPRSLF
jgi:hypothetical protein